jgi:hypothetical protein
MLSRAYLAAAALLVLALPLPAQDFSPPASKPPDAATLKAIKDKTNHLGAIINSLRKAGVGDPGLADVEVYYKAAVWIVRENEFFQPDSPALTLEVLDRGLLRASQLAQGETTWIKTGGEYPFLAGRGSAVARAYRSVIDGSVQPFAVTYPADFGKDPKKRWPIHVVLHGRDPGLTEVKFLHQHNGTAEAPKGQAFVRLDIYGRGNNAYRWAGENDIGSALQTFLAVEAVVSRDKLLDRTRVVLRGFSMGGAGTWQTGLHYPDQWCVLGPGAGFTSTHGYVKDLPEKLPPWQERCLRIYDAADYADNVFNVPVVAYAGADDPQLQAARTIEERLKGADFMNGFKLLVAPALAHRFPPEWQARAEKEYAPFVAKGRPDYPPRVRFVTYTLRYPRCEWVQILALDRHYDRALVDAKRTENGFDVKTTNVRTLHLTLPPGVSQEQTVAIDGQTLTAVPRISGDGSYHLYLQRRGDRWAAVLAQRVLTEALQHPRKESGLQGPIDDAYTDSFLCVVGTGTKGAWHEATQKYAEANLERFKKEWRKHWRGELQVKDDVDVSDDDIASRHLVLFGDPSSNSLIAQVLDGLPLEWTREAITLGGKKYAAAEHVPVMIYRNPLNPGRYVVLNSGHTFHEADYRGTNALLYPRLGDYAVLKLSEQGGPLATEVAVAGLFDDAWKIGTK